MPILTLHIADEATLQQVQSLLAGLEGVEMESETDKAQADAFFASPQVQAIIQERLKEAEQGPLIPWEEAQKQMEAILEKYRYPLQERRA